uniref:Protein kinase domain-containing protein n=1 Tax=Echeneis naucrates TaxID=173247 RepID=A0A665U0Q7_ECHNA
MGARLTLANKQPDKFEIESNTLLKGETGVYEIHKSLGKGVYGQVAKCTKLDTGEEVAVKILEINFRPLKLPEIRVITQQMLVALRALNSIDLSHTDIKPDNIMFTDYRQEHLRVKLIDFGLAAHVSTMRLGQKIQAIGYRAPEVIMGIPLTVAVDMWSLGCLLAFMYLGQNLFPISCPYQPIEPMFSPWRLTTEEEYNNFTNSVAQHYSDAKAFLSLLKRMLCIDPEKRITPEQALGHRFITMRHFSHPQLSLYEAAALSKVKENLPKRVKVKPFVTPSERPGNLRQSLSSSDDLVSAKKEITSCSSHKSKPTPELDEITNLDGGTK